MPLQQSRVGAFRLNNARLNYIRDLLNPSVPAGVTATAAAYNQINLAWTASTDDIGVVAYHIERQDSATGPFTEIGTAAGVSYQDFTVTWLHTYTYRVRARDAAGKYSGYSATATATTPDRPAPTTIKIKIGGVWTDVSQYALVEDATITEALNEVPDTATIHFKQTVPQPLKGKEIQFTDSTGTAFFAGHVLAVRTVYAGKHTNVLLECDCIDYTWALNFQKVTKQYLSATVSTIVNDLVASFGPPGFTVVLTAAVPNTTIAEITFTNEELAQCISRTCERLGLYWLVDYQKVVRVFTSAAISSAGTITQADPRTSSELQKHEDLSPVATVVLGRGGGSAAATDAIAGQTTLPITEPDWYPGGSLVESGPQRFTYTAVNGGGGGSTMGKIAAPTAAMNYFSPGQTGTGNLAAGTYLCAVTNVTPEGETLIGPIASVTCPANSNIMVGIYSANIPTDPKIKAFRFYVSTPNGAQASMRMLRYDNRGNDANSYGMRWDMANGYFLHNESTYVTTTPAPTASTAGDASIIVQPGSTTLPVDDLASYPSSGWVFAPTGQILRYTGKSGSSGAGTLTGIPASGIGAITAPIKAGTIKVAPWLDGIPSSGANAIKVPIKTGDEVYVCVERSDATAISNLQGWIGYGDGRRYEFLTDGRLSLQELTTRCDALLAYRKDPLVTVTFTTRDPAVSVGKTITINTTAPPISGTFLIQRVQVSDLSSKAHIKQLPALRAVEASSRRFTFDDLIQQIKLLGRIN